MRAGLVSVGYSRWTIRPPVYQLITLRIIFALSDVFLCCYYGQRNICIVINSDELSHLQWLIYIDHLYFTSKATEISHSKDTINCLEKAMKISHFNHIMIELCYFSLHQ